MKLTDDQLREVLVPPGHVRGEDFDMARKKAERNKEVLYDVLIEDGLITDENLGRAIANFFDFHFQSLNNIAIEDQFLEYFPEVVARSQRSIVFETTENTIKVATSEPDNYEFIALLEKKTGKEVQVFFTTEKQLEEALRHYKGDLRDQLTGLISHSEATNAEGDIIRIVDLFLEYAHDSRASDIHLEPLEDEVLVRYRVDGILHEVVRYPKPLHEKIVFRTKIMSRLQTDEHAAAQDGRFGYTHDGETFDVRVSVIPITEGENIVMRLLASRMHQYTLETLGLRENDYRKIVQASEKPHGMILAVGPTGSGKTTVLYTILRKLNQPEVNIMTIEDPVEYDVEGVQQTQVNQKKNLTFSTGLRSIVRQDPDIVMVGEIRDDETADIAVNAAMTGHLLLSTLHTNDAATTFPRLIEMNVEPFLIASSVNVIAAVRLVRIICGHCKESYIPIGNERKLLHVNPKVVDYIRELEDKEDVDRVRLYRGRGCKVCDNTGYVGRIGIYEILEMNEEIRILVTKKASAAVISEAAQKSGMTPLLYDGIAKMLSGVTTLEEVLKAANA